MTEGGCIWVCACVCACVRMCARVCVRRVCVCVCVCERSRLAWRGELCKGGISQGLLLSNTHLPLTHISLLSLSLSLSLSLLHSPSLCYTPPTLPLSPPFSL